MGPLHWFRRGALRGQRGANALEFALTLPVFIAITMGTIEYGWVYYQRSGVTHAMRLGCRDGALIHPDDVPGPSTIAYDSIERRLLQLGVNCSDNPSPCSIHTEMQGASPNEIVYCSAAVTYTSITNLVPIPDRLSGETRVNLELQR